MGLAATIPGRPISTVASRRSNRISCSRSPGRTAGKYDIDVAARLEAGQLDHALREIENLHGLSHFQDVYRGGGFIYAKSVINTSAPDADR
jgi:hypothetical protein